MAEEIPRELALACILTVVYDCGQSAISSTWLHKADLYPVREFVFHNHGDLCMGHIL